MKVIADKRLFWFLKDNQQLDLDNQCELDMLVQQILMAGNSKDIRFLFHKSQ